MPVRRGWKPDRRCDVLPYTGMRTGWGHVSSRQPDCLLWYHSDLIEVNQCCIEDYDYNYPPSATRVTYEPLSQYSACSTLSIQENSGQCTPFTATYSFDSASIPSGATGFPYPYVCTEFVVTPQASSQTSSSASRNTAATNQQSGTSSSASSKNTAATNQQSGASHDAPLVGKNKRSTCAN